MIKEAVQGFVRELLNKPADLAALRDALAGLPAAPAPPRPEMDAAERKSLGVELAAAFDAVVVKGAATFEAKRVELEGRSRAAQDGLRDLRSDRDQALWRYTDRRDPVQARLWAERPAEVDELIAHVEGEARTLRVDVHNLNHAGPSPGSNVFLGNHPTAVGALLSDVYPDVFARQINNSESVELRRVALLGLAEQLREWTRKGVFGTVAELREMYATAYGKLPKVEELRDVMGRDERGKAALRVA